MNTFKLNGKTHSITAPQQRVIKTIARNGGATILSDLAEGSGRRTSYPCDFPFTGMAVVPASWVKIHPTDYPVAVRRVVKASPRAQTIAYLTPRTGRAILAKI